MSQPDRNQQGPQQGQQQDPPTLQDLELAYEQLSIVMPRYIRLCDVEIALTGQVRLLSQKIVQVIEEKDAEIAQLQARLSEFETNGQGPDVIEGSVVEDAAQSG